MKQLIIICVLSICILLAISMCAHPNVWNNGLCIYCSAPYTTLETIIDGTECVAFKCEMCGVLDYIEKFKIF